MNTKTKQEKIDKVMDNFDFGRVVKTMQALDWNWIDEGVPSESEVRKEARRLLKQISNAILSEPTSYSIATGGFCATRFSDGELRLQFIVSEYDTEEL
jgi:enoyl-CoA hydratase/carnithine racemase